MEFNDALKENTLIAYISMEIGVESNIPTYSGGLGVLSGDAYAIVLDISSNYLMRRENKRKRK